MLRFHPIADAKAAEAYYSKSDGGYYLDADDLRSEWLGRGAEQLDLSGKPDFEHFKRLIHGLDPRTGEQLTAKLIDNRIPAWDVTASIPKGVTIALERGDSRIQDALWEAARDTIADLEQYATTRVRKGGKQEDRVTGNLVAFAVEHPETRPAKSDNMPDPDRHIHMVVFNLTHDEQEGEWKAVKFRPIMDLRKYFDRRFDQRLASKLTDLGYGIETKYKADTQGGKRYFSWDIKDMPQLVVKTFSRRAGEVDTLAAKLGVSNPMSKDKLGATSRQFKRKDMTLADYRSYWDARVSPEEVRQVAEVIKAAMRGENAKPKNTVDKAVQYAIGHHFERRSVMDWHEVAITAMERSMGGAKPEEIEPEARRQGVLLRDGEATTKEVLAEEARVIAFAREGRGACRKMGAEARLSGSPNNTRIVAGMQLDVGSRPDVSGQRKGERVERSGQASPTYPGQAAAATRDTATTTVSRQQKGRPDESKRPLVTVASTPALQSKTDTATLSPEQQALCRHIWDSTDRVIMIEGDAGTGKTQTMQRTIPGIDMPGIFLAPSASASRGELRDKGFTNADTLARFMLDEKFREQARNGYIYIDESPLAGLKDIDRVIGYARELNARLILQGDRKQHKSLQRGNLFHILDQYADLPIGRLTENWRQKNAEYKQVVSDIAGGKGIKGFDKLAEMGWVKQVEDNSALVADYMTALRDGKSVLVVAPTHAEGEEVTAGIRTRLKEQGVIHGDERTIDQLKPLHWTEAERGDLERYDGTEVMVFHRNSGTFKAGQKVRFADWKPTDRFASASHFSVHTPGKLQVAAGDTIRLTSGGKSKDGHKLNNGSSYEVKGFDKDGNIVLANGWTVGADFRHLDHGYVSTSFASQGKTVDRVMIAMGAESIRAMNAEQFYVSVSRGRESARVYSDLPNDQLREAILKTDPRKSASELMGRAKPKPKPKRKGWLHAISRKAQERFRRLRDGLTSGNREHGKQRENDGGRQDR